jgi:hypothetical protein
MQVILLLFILGPVWGQDFGQMFEMYQRHQRTNENNNNNIVDVVVDNNNNNDDNNTLPDAGQQLQADKNDIELGTWTSNLSIYFSFFFFLYLFVMLSLCINKFDRVIKDRGS